MLALPNREVIYHWNRNPESIMGTTPLRAGMHGTPCACARGNNHNQSHFRGALSTSSSCQNTAAASYIKEECAPVVGILQKQPALASSFIQLASLRLR